MPFIRFVKDYPALEVAAGATLMAELRAAGLPVASSCNGDGVCAKCRIQIVEGAENLSRETPLEEILRARNRIPRDQRVSCQTKVLGDIKVDTGYW